MRVEDLDNCLVAVYEGDDLVQEVVNRHSIVVFFYHVESGNQVSF